MVFQTRKDKIYDNFRFRYLLNPTNSSYKSIVTSTRNITKRDLNADTISIASNISGDSFTRLREWSWVETGGGTLGNNKGQGVAVDSTGNLYVTGFFSGLATFGTITVAGSGTGAENIFVAKYNSVGNVLWVSTAGGVFDAQGNGIAVDSMGHSYITGFLRDVATFGTITVIGSPGSEDIFIAQYNSSGNVEWVSTAGGDFDDIGLAVAVDFMGRSYITGGFRQVATFGTITVIGTPSSSIFVAKYNIMGDVKWVSTASGDGDQGRGIAVDSAGNSYITGYFLGTATFGTITVSGEGFENIFVAKYNTLGVVKWVATAGGTGTDFSQGNSIALDSAGNLYITGFIVGTATFGTITVGGGGQDIFVAKYNSSGIVKWVKTASGTTFLNEGTSIAVDSTENSYITGYFADVATFGTITVTGSGRDIFVAKYNSSGIIQWVETAGGITTDEGLGIIVDSIGNAYITGHFIGDATFGTIMVTSLGVPTIFVAKLILEGTILVSTGTPLVKSTYGLNQWKNFGVYRDKNLHDIRIPEGSIITR